MKPLSFDISTTEYFFYCTFWIVNRAEISLRTLSSLSATSSISKIIPKTLTQRQWKWNHFLDCYRFYTVAHCLKISAVWRHCKGNSTARYHKRNCRAVSIRFADCDGTPDWYATFDVHSEKRSCECISKITTIEKAGTRKWVSYSSR